MNKDTITAIISKNRRHLTLFSTMSIEKFIILLPKYSKIKLSIKICNYNDNTNYLRLLLRYIEPYNNIFLDACFYGRIEIIKCLLEDKRANPSIEGNWASSWVCRGGYLDILKLLLKDERVNKTIDLNYLLINACSNGRLNIVEFLISDKKVDPSFELNKALLYTKEYKQHHIIQFLLQDERVINTKYFV